MKRMMFCVPLLAIAVCSVAIAEPRGLFRTASLPNAEESAAPVSLVGFFSRGGGGYGAGYDMASPSCGIEAGCDAAPSCGGEDYWSDYCCAPRGRHFHLGRLFHRHRGGCGVEASCGCDVAAPNCGIEPACGAAPSCGVEAADCGCGRRSHFGHHLFCGHGRGCGFGGCGCRCVGHPHRYWANGWCGQIVDGYCGGNPVDCSGGGMGLPAKALPAPEYAPEPQYEPEAAPMDVPPKSTRRTIHSPRFSTLPIGAGVK